MWSVILVDEVEKWFLDLAGEETDTADAIEAAIDILAEEGPTLGRPLVDRIKGAEHHNMKELRPSGTHVRVLFIFDPERRAVLLIGGDKSGNWNGWYRDNIPVAEQRYRAWQEENEDG